MLEKEWASMKDFAALFQYLWYQDFPISRKDTIGACQADWTKHIDRVVGDIAHHMGLVTRFEARGRIDAILRSSDGDEIAIEWEWGGGWVKELKKLKELKEHKKLRRNDEEGLKYAVLITYSYDIESSKKRAEDIWKEAPWPLLLILIEAKKVLKRVLFAGREFVNLRMCLFDKENESGKLLREAPALPWEVPKTRWSYEIK